MGSFVFLFVLLCCHFSVFSNSEKIIVNSQIDDMLVDFRNFIISAGKDSLPIDDFEEVFEIKIGSLINAKVGYKATGGSMRSMSSVIRIRDAVLLTKMTSSFFYLHLGLDHFEVNFDNYTAYFQDMKMRGVVRLTVLNSSYRAFIALRGNEDDCVPVLTRLEVGYFDGINLDFTGLGPLNRVFEITLSRSLERRFYYDIMFRVKDEFANNLKKFKSNQMLCNITTYIKNNN